MDRKRLAMKASLAVAVLMLVGKFTAFLITGSTAILSDAAESVIHIFATGFAAVSLWFADRPPDTRHPYGHGRIMSFSVALEGLLIFGAAVFIIAEAAVAIVEGPTVHRLDYGLAITTCLAMINLALGWYLIHVGKVEHSPILVANGHHVLTDMWTSLIVLVGVFLVWLTNLTYLDPLCAIVAAVGILYTGSTLIKEAVSSALDEVSPEDTKRIQDVLDALQQEGVISGYHQLRHRKINAALWVELHILVPGKLTVSSAHRLVTKAERRIEAAFVGQEVYITSHIEPDDHQSAHPEGHREDPLSAEQQS